MRHEKCAVFQVTNGQGITSLICIPVATFGDGARLETELRESCGACFHISFLGRFDEIRSATGPEEVLELLQQPRKRSLLMFPRPLLRADEVEL